MNTAEVQPTVSLGLPVEIGRIDKELARLWQQGDGVLTRASLINFVVYCEGVQAMHDNTELIARFMQSHACRAILVAVQPGAAESAVHSWISAHCHVSRAGAKQVCCEQLTFLLEGDNRDLIPNIVFSHLDSDLPLYVWWQSEFPDTIDDHLWTWVDRLIFDSATWVDPRRSVAALDQICAGNRDTLMLCDLNWSRLNPWRRALKRVFDNPDNLTALSSIEQVRITHAPGFRSTAALFASWMAGRLGGDVQIDAPDCISFGNIRLEFAESEGAPIHECTLTSLHDQFTLRRSSSIDFIQAEVRATDGRCYTEALPARDAALLDLLNRELARGRRPSLYRAALQTAVKFM